jgi:type II secretory pathway component PulF
LRLLAVALEENLDLIPLLEAWAADERGLQQHRLYRLVELLKGGRPIQEALEEIPGLVGEEGLLALRFDSQPGMRTAAVRQELNDASVAGPPPKGRRAFAYFCVLIVLGLPVVAFLQVAILPPLKRIFSEFDVQPTEAMRWWDGFASVAGKFWWLILLFALVSLFVALFSRGRRIHAAFSRLWLGWEQPPLSADVLQKVSLALQAGRPLTSALSTLARYYFDPATRHRLLFVRNEVEQGVDPWRSLADVHFLTSEEVQLLASAEKVGNQPSVLRFIAHTIKQRNKDRLSRWAEAVLPVLVLIAGGFVLFLALAYFGPLVQLILTLDKASP